MTDVDKFISMTNAQRNSVLRKEKVAKTDKERKAAERQRNKAAGLVRMELWVHPRDADEIKRVAFGLQLKRKKGAQ